MTSSEALKNALSKPSCISISNTAKPIPPLERSRRGLFASKFRHASGTNPTDRRARPGSLIAIIQIDPLDRHAVDCSWRAKPRPPPSQESLQIQRQYVPKTSLPEARFRLGSPHRRPLPQPEPGKNWLGQSAAPS